MQKSDLKEFMDILEDMAVMLGADISPRRYELYFKTLFDLDIQDVRKAANQIARTATFFPKPVDFRNAINGNQDEAAIAAWEKVQKGKSKAGQYQSVRFDDPVIHGAIKLMGGWASVCQLENYSDEKWQRVDFDKIYKAIQDQREGHPEYLMGLAELQENALMPYDKKNIVEIGPIKERVAIAHAGRKALPEPEKILSQKEVSERIKDLCDNIKTVEDGPHDEDMPCMIE